MRGRAVKVRWEPNLVAELVIAEAKRDRAFGEACRRRLETIYELADDERRQAFATAYNNLFEEHRLGESLTRLLAEFPMVQGLREVLVFKTDSLKDEGADLSRDKTKMGLRIKVERLGSPERLVPFLRHELMHISDMLNPAFGYRDEPLDEVQQHLVPRRYQVLWDTCIDGRLAKSGQPGLATKEERQREFERLFTFLPRQQRLPAFEKLWDSEDITHAQLFELALEPSRLGLFGAGVEKVSSLPIAGTYCPLCQFPTYEWAEPEGAIIAAIQRDYPAWTPEDGICGRCYEYYQMHYQSEGARI